MAKKKASKKAAKKAAPKRKMAKKKASKKAAKKAAPKRRSTRTILERKVRRPSEIKHPREIVYPKINRKELEEIDLSIIRDYPMPEEYDRIFRHPLKDVYSKSSRKFVQTYKKILKSEKRSLLQKLFFLKCSANLLKDDTYELNEKHVPTYRAVQNLYRDLYFFRLDKLASMLRPSRYVRNSKLDFLMFNETKDLLLHFKEKCPSYSLEEDFYNKLIDTMQSENLNDFLSFCDKTGKEEKKIESMLRKEGLLSDFRKTYLNFGEKK